ncbi:hypothetical protein B9Z46_13240 [Limnohabitans sp. Hippo4]|nr:hypothetical protein B9Z46_13240 [Limnohabitans sp. Hippo4]
MKNTLRITFVTLLASLLIACGGGGSGGCSAVLGILPGSGCSASNTPPVANAGVTQNVITGSVVTLDGSGSRDINNQSLTYLWQLSSAPAGSLAALSSATSAKPTFTADLTGTYTFSLVVNDGKANSQTSIVNVYATVSNAAPVANAGNNQSVSIGSVVTLDGTSSSDANRDSLTYKWSLGSLPSGSGATLSSVVSPNPKFTADVAGTYSAILIVNDGKADSSASVVTVTATNENKKPVAKAGNAQYISLKATPTTVTLDGTDSSDPDKDFISYKWVLITRPSGSSALLINSTTPKPSFIPDVAGTYVASLIVNDGKLDSEAAATTITVSAKNSEPVAIAGIPQNVKLGLVTLDGTNSKDDDGDPLGFMWVMVSKPATSRAELLQATSPKPTFQADVVGTYVVTLVVTDSKLAKSSPSTTTITAALENRPPTASAGSNRNEVLGTITLDASKSLDLDGDTLTYKWSLLAKPDRSSAALSSTTMAMPTFNADLAGIYVFGLIVNDGKVDSAPVTVTVTASAANQAPTAVAGDPKNVITNTLVTLDGSKSSDPNPGDSLTYKWSLVTKPIGSSVSTLTNNTTAMPTFTPDVSGVYLISLSVSDGKLESPVVTTTVTAANVNLAPSANAGLAQNVSVGTQVTLDGSASSDPNGDTLTYQWLLVAKPPGSSAELLEAATPKPKFTADTAGIYIASLVVSDGRLSSTLTTTTVSATVANRAPTANAGSYQNVVTGLLVSVSGAASSDPDGDALSYNWAMVSKPANSSASLMDSTKVSPSFTADKSGTYVLSLQVSDGRLTSNYSYITITAGAANLAPTAIVNAVAPVTVGTQVTLDASNSTDPNGDVILYRWVLTYRPANSQAVLTDNTAARPKFNADQPGVYVATLVVSDGRLDSQQVTVAVTASP